MSTTKHEEKQEEKQIGNTRFTQAMGEAGNVGIVATVASTAIIATILYFGKDKVEWIRKGIDKIEGAFDWAKKKLGNGSGNGSKKISDIMASLTAASGIGYLIGHFAMIPAFKEGWRKADAEKSLLDERGKRIQLLEEKVANQEKILSELQSGETSKPTFVERLGRDEKKVAQAVAPRASYQEEASKSADMQENVRA
jgi:hypothetical protein